MVVTEFSIRTLMTDVELVSETSVYLDHLTRLPATDDFSLILSSPSKLYITMPSISYGPMVHSFLCSTTPKYFMFDLKKVTFALLLSVGI